ncbi:zinc ribbon domain-containing protein [bacterium]|nr:zinc ribbon domain-containing protein [bacterium]
MPIYKYQCRKCGYQFERLVFGKEKIRCPKCESSSLKKLISTPTGMLNSDSNSSRCSNGSCNFNCPYCH